jgi:hypothetical protein
VWCHSEMEGEGRGGESLALNHTRKHEISFDAVNSVTVMSRAN